ncbi:hypothetical protein ACNKU7_11455 [Microbulbifer sp. SA54]|uniref:hypothetical protein n=1 Tax=Microbulbifer sp. SA54 TaxID=3401577 RepID=UPI003AAEE791
MKKSLVLAAFALIAGCGGGSGSKGSDDSGNGGDGGSSTVTKTFTVSLEQVQVNRVSNGDPVEIDINEVSNSGSVTVSE